MTDLTNFGESTVRDWMSQGTSPTAIGTVYVALHTSDPGETPDGSTEVGAADYSRVGVSAGSGWDTPSAGQFDNANDINFGVATNNWGTITHVSLWDSSTGGNAMAAFAVNTQKTIDVDDEARFLAGDLTFTIA